MIKGLKPPELSIEDGAQSSFVAFFRGLNQDPNVIRIFDRKGYYSIHGEHALIVAQIFYKTTAVVKYMGAIDPLPGVAVNRNMLEGVLREFLIERAEFMVELYEGHSATWAVTRSGSPGQLSDFEDELFRSSDAIEVPTILAVVIGSVGGEQSVGTAYVDLESRLIGACQFHDDMEYCTLETLIIQLDAKECVIQQESKSGTQIPDILKIKDVIKKCRAMPVDKPKKLYNTNNLKMDLERLLKSSTVEQHRDVLERPLARAALAGVIAFMDLMSDASHHGKMDLVLHDIQSSMRLDAAAQKALNVFPQRTNEDKLLSLYGLLNQARTAMGKRKLKIWMKQPLVDVKAVNGRLDLVQCFAEDSDLRKQLRNCLRGFPDILRLARKLARKKSSLADLCQMYRASSMLPKLEACVRSAGISLLDTKFADLFGVLHDDDRLGRYEQLIEAAIDLDKIPDQFLISPQYDAGLEELRIKKDKVEAEIERLFQKAATDLNLVADKTLKLDWYKAGNSKIRCLRITQKEERILRKTLQQSFTILEARKDGTKFVSPELRKVSEHLQTISNEYETMQSNLVSEVLRVAATFVEVFEEAGDAIAEIDVVAGLADIARNAPVPYVRPIILGGESGKISLKGSRHPLVEAQDGIDFIKNNCEMVRGESWFQIVTGPNMGGKSTFIRQVGVCVLMAQIGSYVPCDEATISVRDCIFARVGAGDFQLRGVSTFMAEMLETAAILKGATEKSLVIIDELGRGTSTYDGFGLAWAISHHIMQVMGCPTLFATHFHELTAISGPGGVKNTHVETCIDDSSGRLTMLYQVADGACDQSFGVHVAEFAQFPAGVVQAAKKRLRDMDERDKELMSLWEKRKKTDAERQAYARIDYFIHQVSSINIDELQGQQSVKALESIMSELDSDVSNNPVLLGLLSESP